MKNPGSVPARRIAVPALVALLTLGWGGIASAQFGGMLKGLGKKAIEEGKKEGDKKPEEKPAEPEKKPEPESKPSDTADKKNAPATASDASGQPAMTATKIDFVAGEKTVFYDDFSDMVEDEPPPHWKVRGDAVEFRKGGNVRELYFPKTTELSSGALSIPKNFTLQVVIGPDPHYQSSVTFAFQNKKDDRLMTANVSIGDGNAELSLRAAGEGVGSTWSSKIDLKQPISVDVWMQDGRLRGYVNGERIIDGNQIALPSDISNVYWEAHGPISVRSIRIAESAPDFGKVIANSGKYVTHGINFDVDSDHLRPESGAVLKMVARGLEANPNLKLAIGGYTDSTGDAAHNKDLSKRRAEAVKNVLVQQFGVDASRLTAAGYGADTPIASNDTPEGRAENRRVEFVKQ